MPRTAIPLAYGAGAGSLRRGQIGWYWPFHPVFGWSLKLSAGEKGYALFLICCFLSWWETDKAGVSAHRRCLVRYFCNRWIRITCKLSNISQNVKENIPLLIIDFWVTWGLWNSHRKWKTNRFGCPINNLFGKFCISWFRAKFYARHV